MSIAKAVLEIESSTVSDSIRRARSYRAQQHLLDELIERTELLVMNDCASTPAALRSRAEAALTLVQGTSPDSADGVGSPVSLLDHLLVAEGRLRQRYYGHAPEEIEDLGPEF